MADERVQQGGFDGFVHTIAALRAPDGCPWDRKQTHASIAKNMLEEAFEAVDAIEEGDPEHLCEELGDVLLEVVLQAQIASDEGEFTIDDVVDGIQAKIVRRHPHVFGNEQAFAALGIDPGSVRTPDDVNELWGLVKAYEKRVKQQHRREKRIAAGLDPDVPEGLLEGVSRTQPALMEAQEISRKAVKAGFEWESEQAVWDQVHEEVGEFLACDDGDLQAQTMEFGDILFSLVNVARKRGIDAETALRLTCAKFRGRWATMEQEAHASGTYVSDLSTEQQELLWQRAKEKETR